MQSDWTIQGRAEKCAVTGREFQDGEYFYTLLLHDRDGFHRQDLSEEAWQQRNDNIAPFSFWRSKFEPPPPSEPEALEKETAEDLLRRYMAEPNGTHANARYILALMLERKRLLKQTQVEDTEGVRTLIYTHVKTGEIFVIPDPELRLDQLENVQNEVAALLR
ncbi:MAG: hypothetical protein QOD99_1967 [Chthoniobacter sp.]|jgi:hypothetical protein|nr:hypothetical protein [Chthoniobacter sp.]